MIEPKLRFKRDDGTAYPAWEAKVFGSVMTVLPNNTLSRDELTYDADGIKNVHYGDVLIKFGACLDISSVQLPAVVNPQKVRNLSLARLRNGDVVIADTAEDSTVGKATEIVGCEDELVVSGLHTIPCRPEDNYFALGFLGYYINSSVFHDQLKTLMQGVKVTSISRKAVQEETFLSLPCLEEQQKIAAFLSDLDAVISASEAEAAALEQQKKGAMQKIFSQKVRFRRDDGTEYPEWEEKTLNDVCAEFKSGKNIKADLIEVEGQYAVYGGNGIRGYTNKYSHDGTYAIIGRQGALCGNVTLITGKNYLTEHAIAVKADENNVTIFLRYLLQDMSLGQYSDQSAQPGLAVNKLIKLKNKFPAKEEQQKIAAFLSSFDEAIALARQELEKWKLLKKGLMQQMFV